MERISKDGECANWKTGGWREGQSLSLPYLKLFVHRHLKGVTGGREGKISNPCFLPTFTSSSSGNKVKRIDTFTPSSFCHLFTYKISETGTPHRVIIDLLDKKIDLSLHISETFCTFAIVPIPKPCLWAGLTRSGDLYIGKALLDALCLTFRNLAVPNYLSRDKATMTLMGM